MSTPCNCHTSLKNFKNLKYIYDVRDNVLSLRYKSKSEWRNNYEIKKVGFTPREKEYISESMLMSKLNLSIREKECPIHHLCHEISLIDNSSGKVLDYVHRDVHKIYIQYEVLED